jgi:hypothetical protein
MSTFSSDKEEHVEKPSKRVVGFIKKFIYSEPFTNDLT